MGDNPGKPDRAPDGTSPPSGLPFNPATAPAVLFSRYWRRGGLARSAVLVYASALLLAAALGPAIGEATDHHAANRGTWHWVVIGLATGIVCLVALGGVVLYPTLKDERRDRRTMR